MSETNTKKETYILGQVPTNGIPSIPPEILQFMGLSAGGFFRFLKVEGTQDVILRPIEVSFGNGNQAPVIEKRDPVHFFPDGSENVITDGYVGHFHTSTKIPATLISQKPARPAKSKKLDPSEVKSAKRKLVKMAKAGDPKLTKEHSLHSLFTKLVNRKGEDYDRTFRSKIKKANPAWLETSADIKKNKLIEMALNNEGRPKTGSPLYWALINYTSKGRSGYSQTFAKKIKKMRPDWFDGTVEASSEPLEAVHADAHGHLNGTLNDALSSHDEDDDDGL